MKSELSSLDLHYLLRELAVLSSAKVENIYQLGKEEIVFQFHVPGEGKRVLRIVLGKLMYLASAKGDMPEKPPGFCLFLRRRLKNARFREIRQFGFERIVEFLFETKEAKYRFVVELFSRGNAVLCDESGKILSVLERQEWKDRSIKPGQVYDYPKKEVNFLELTRESLSSVLARSDKENLVKSLAIDLGLGGIYAEELCLQAKVDKSLKPGQLSDKELDSLFSASQGIVQRGMSAEIVSGSRPGDAAVEIVPFSMDYFRSKERSQFPSFNEALDSVFTTKSEAKALDATESAAKKKLDKFDEMIRQQTQRIEGLELSEKDNQRKGEVIYENYPLVNEVISEVRELKKRLSWKEIGEHFKGHKIIRNIDVTTGELTLEL
ncbi:NFACT family protein [Candidatus Woesearchaeota archaeon]|nr:NFACT family protein [Candidatus Woesearchaeota archaeon]